MTPTVIRYYHIRQNEEKRGHYIQPQSKKDHPKPNKTSRIPHSGTVDNQHQRQRNYTKAIHHSTSTRSSQEHKFQRRQRQNIHETHQGSDNQTTRISFFTNLGHQSQDKILHTN